MQPTSVCGIGHEQSLSTASNSALECLLAQLGRNAPVVPGTDAAYKEAEIKAILASRAQSGVVVADDGAASHHPV